MPILKNIKDKNFSLMFVYSKTMFLSAFLLFLVQPMFGKIILPLLGGAPAVWNGCMLFYQTLLLLGYLYAHFLGKYFELRGQVLIHIALLVLSALFLPVGLSDWVPEGGSNPVVWLLCALFIAVGVPFFVVSSTSPLIQRWFSLSSHKDAADPYFLYASSNIGSMIGLLSYPLFFEPRFKLSQQTYFWTFLYVCLCLLLVVCGLLIAKNNGIGLKNLFLNINLKLFKKDTSKTEVSPAPALSTRIRWLLLSFCPSGLMLAVTTYITTDLAAIPLLWVIPLAFYLFSFILVFARSTSGFHIFWVHAHLYVFLFFICFFISDFHSLKSMPVLHIFAFFLTAMVCHGELAKTRPAADRLTEFYLFMSVGGALGGLFSAVVAPLVFNWVAEYPILLVLSLLLRPGNFLKKSSTRQIAYDFFIPLAVFLVMVSIFLYEQHNNSLNPKAAIYLAFIVIGSSVAISDRPIRLGLLVAAMIFCGFGLSGRHNFFNIYERTTVKQERSFFGTITIVYRKNDMSSFYMLHHGTTLHGAQSLDEEFSKEPLTYYNKTGPLGQVFHAYDNIDDNWNVASVGLGAGTTSCYAKPTQNWTYFEIDPMILTFSKGDKKGEKFFTYLDRCAPHAKIVLGDARLSMKEQDDDKYNLLILDAFSSDAIPVHLITKDAIEMYFKKMKKGGLIAFHISNRYLRLEPVLSNIARENGYVSLVLAESITNYEKQMMMSASQWVVMAKEYEDVEPLLFEGPWRLTDDDTKVGVWTDDFSNLITIMYEPKSKIIEKVIKLFRLDGINNFSENKTQYNLKESLHDIAEENRKEQEGRNE
ncbi:MAG: spermidine synthase [Alphaproteobacteria bacterium]